MDHPRTTPPFTVNVPVSATDFAVGTLEEVSEYLRRFADTNDGEGGVPEPNTAAYLLGEVETAIARLERDTPTPAAGTTMGEKEDMASRADIAASVASDLTGAAAQHDAGGEG